MKCLSIQQPWAAAIVLGCKPVENRTWVSRYRGLLLIHAGKTFDMEGWEFIQTHFGDASRIIRLQTPTFSRGAIIGCVNMVDCVTECRSPWFGGPYGFIFTDPKRFKKPVSYKGQLGMFEVPDDVVRVLL